MTTLMSASKALDIVENEDGTFTTTKSGDGLAKGLMAEVTGLFNGGKTHSVGLSHTVFAIGVPAAAAAYEHKVQTGAWGIPFKQA